MKISLRLASFDRLKFLFGTSITHILIILLLGIVSYVNSLYVPVQFDDAVAVRDNIGIDLYSIKGFIGISRWFTDITFALNRRLYGEQVLGFHLFNLTIHLLSAVVIYLLIQQIIETLKRTYRISGDDDSVTYQQYFIPFATAAFFVCHPVQTQAVTYIVQRYTSLATFLYLSSLLSYLLARVSLTGEIKKLQVWSWGFACFLAALLAMKSKEIAFTLPLMIVALEVALFRGQLLRNRLFLVLAAVLLLVIPLQLIYPLGTGEGENLLNQVHLATAETQTISRTDYLLTQIRVVVTYLRLLILPVNQNMDYDYPVYHSLFNPPVFAALLLHISLMVSALVLFIRSQRHLTSGALPAGITMRLASLGIFWFYLAMSVESSFIPIRDVLFEHRIYLPSTGFFLAVAATMAGMAAHRQRYRNALWVAVVLICLIFTASTIARNRIWSNDIAMLQDVLEKSPNKARVSHAVGMLYFKKIMPEKALPHLVKALELDPGRDTYWDGLDDAIWIIRKYRGRCSDGSKYHSDIKPANSEDPIIWRAISYNNLGLVYEHLSNLSLARENYQKAVNANPSIDLAWCNLALVAALQDDTSTVAASLQKLRTLNPRLEQDAAKVIQKTAASKVKSTIF